MTNFFFIQITIDYMYSVYQAALKYVYIICGYREYYV